jgi:hypothetical protein
MRTLRFLNGWMLKLVILNAAVLFLLAGSVIPARAQDDKQQDNKPAQRDQTRPDDASRPQDAAKPARPDEGNPPRQDEKQNQMRGQDQLHPQATPGRQDHPEQPSHEGQAAPHQHPANDHGGRIPDKQFHAHFGQPHHFRAQGVIVAGQPRFQYGGYTFEFVQPWPVGWAYTDYCYIDFIDGQYYLIDLSHPGIEIPLIVIL